MINILLSGFNGKMGQKIREAVAENNQYKIVAGIDKNTESTDVPCFASPKDCNIPADVIIDFSHFSLTPEIIEYAVMKKLPLVLATTALSDDIKEQVNRASNIIPIFLSANMSLGVNTIIKALKEITPALEKNFNIEIIEKHHNQKKDSPSGTALMLADSINEVCANKKEYIYGRHSNCDECGINQMGIHSVRGGTISGEHIVIFAGDDEIIEIKHTALSKKIFANGALKAAEIIIEKENGIYGF